MGAAQGPDRQRSAGLEAIAYGAVAITTRALAKAGLDLTFAQWRALVIVGESVEGATVTEVAARLGAEISPASRLVSRLRRRGFVQVHKDEQDRRVSRITVTETGRELRASVLAYRRELLADALVAVGPLGADVEAGLDRIGEELRRYT